MADKGFWGGLFDFSFTEFVTIRVVRVLYVLAIIASVIGGIAVLGSGIAMLKVRGALGLLVILLSPVAFFLYLLFARIWLELIVVIFRIAENTGKLVEQGKS